MKTKALLLVVLCTFALSCEKEHEPFTFEQTLVEKSERDTDLEIYDESFPQLTGLSELADTYRVFRARSESGAKKEAKGKNSDLFNFTVDTTLVRRMVSEGKTSYTFFVRREEPVEGVFENLVIEKDSAGQVVALLIRYRPTTEMAYLPKHATFDFEAEHEVYLLPDFDATGLTALSTVNCYTVSETWCSYDDDHPAGAGCANDGRLYTRTTTYCVESGGGGGGGGQSGGPAGGGSPGGGNPDGNAKKKGTTTSPITGTTTAEWLVNFLGFNVPPESTRMKAYLATRTTFSKMLRDYLHSHNSADDRSVAKRAARASWATLGLVEPLFTANGVNATTSIQARDMADYLTKNNLSTESKGFAKTALDALIKGGKVDFNNELIKDKSFVGTKADCVLESLISSGNNLFRKTSEAFTEGKSKYKIKFNTYTSSEAANARTGLPDANGIIEIKFNLTRTGLYSNSNAMSLATDILHETIHAELHRIKLSNNSGPNPLPSAQYKWYIDMWKRYERTYNQNETATAAEHYYMANYFIDPIATSLREFDDNTHPVDNYKFFAWDGLQQYGKDANYVTQEKLSGLASLAKIVQNDGHKNPCGN